MTNRLSTRRDGAAPVGGFLLVCALATAIAARDLAVPGLYYDEVIQAEPALQFLTEDGRPLEIPGMTSTRLFGRWFPLMTQPYMGALKSQALIPVFAVLEPTVATLRRTTLAWALLGLLLAMLWSRELLGWPIALVAGTLLAVDPSFLFVGRHDWGSFALGLICRCGGLWLVTSGWSRRARGRLGLGGLAFGLGVYNKLDFAIFLAAAGFALALATRRSLAEAFRQRRADFAAACAGFALGAAPVVTGLGEAVAVARSVLYSGGGRNFDWSEKLAALAATLDGSYFERLILAGGSFEQMYAVAGAPPGPFLAIFLGSALFLALRLGRQPRDDHVRKCAFVLLTALLIPIGILIVPRAERIHHALNLYPLPHLVVAIAAVDLWRARTAPWQLRLALRALALLAVCAALGGSLFVGLRTLETLRATGGKGRWSDALATFAAELATRPNATVVSLDWGFHGPLRFVERELRLVEPVWKMRQPLAPGTVWTFDATPEYVYLIYPEAFSYFPYGAALLDAARSLPPQTVAIREHLDRSGELAFLSLRFARPHRLVYRRRFEVKLR